MARMGGTTLRANDGVGVMSDPHGGSLIQEIQKLQKELDLLKSQVERLSGKTQFCPLCESYARERDLLKAKLEMAVKCLKLFSDSLFIDAKEALKRIEGMK